MDPRYDLADLQGRSFLENLAKKQRCNSSRAVEEFRNGEGDESRRLVVVKTCGNYVFFCVFFFVVFFEGKWLVIEILKCLFGFFVRKGTYFLGAYSGIVHN